MARPTSADRSFLDAWSVTELISNKSLRPPIATAKRDSPWASLVRNVTDRGGNTFKLFAAKLPASANSAIIDPARFSRERQMDLCAWCHAGAGSSLQPAFSYIPGEALDKYLALPQPDPSAPVDVHGSQVEMLERSQCFQKSGMTCLTCHDVHAVQHDLSEFSQRCLSCHKSGSAMFPKRGHQVASDCIGCHMPLQETNLIVFDQDGKKAKPKVRNHWIKVYSEALPSP